MNINMKKLIFAFLLFCFSASLFAQKGKTLSVIMNDGTSVYFLLAEQPYVTFVDDAVRIVSSTNEATIERALVNKFEFVDEIPTGIDDVEEVEDKVAADRFELSDNAIRFEGLAPGCAIRLYSVKGEMLMSDIADNNGALTLSLEALPSGVYLVNYNETTIKFIKR